MTDEQQRKLVKLWQAGRSGKQIAYELGLTTSQVFSFACDHRDVCPKRHGKVDLELIESMWLSGHTPQEIAQEAECKAGTVITYAHKHRDRMPPKVKRLTERQKHQIHEMWLQGERQCDIARAVGVSPFSVKKYR